MWWGGREFKAKYNNVEQYVITLAKDNLYSFQVHFYKALISTVQYFLAR